MTPALGSYPPGSVSQTRLRVFLGMVCVSHGFIYDHFGTRWNPVGVNPKFTDPARAVAHMRQEALHL